ncbi:hypothetical protein MASR1M8_21390 [Thermomonas brevis]
MSRLPALLLSLLLASLALAAPALAQERILAYDSDVAINADGSIDVEERIRVRAEGDNIRRGIYREFPTRYHDRRGNRVVVGFEVKEVLRDGRPEPWFIERQSNGVRINTGNDDLLPVPAEYSYTLRYRTTRQLGFFDAHDELYWNAIGTGWMFPIESGRVRLRLPQPVPTADLRLDGYSGRQGAQGRNFSAVADAPGEAEWTLVEPLQPREGLTVVLGFPKGIVTAPSRTQRLRWLLTDNRGLLVALLALMGLVAYCVRRWHQVGRDPAPGIVIARYEPPAGYSPAALRFIQRMGHDTRCFSSDLLDLAVRGCLRIDREKRLLKDEWTLTRLPGGNGGALPPAQHRLLEALFAKGPTLALTSKNASTMQAAGSEQLKSLEAAYSDRMFKRHGGSIIVASLIVVFGLIVAFDLSDGAGHLLLIGVAALMVAVLVAFAMLVRAPTPEGRALLDEIEGLKRYLSVAERDELARMAAPDEPQLDAERYQALLPYAVALEVEDAWTEKFTLAVGAAAAAAAAGSMAWYHGSGGDSLSSLTSAVGSGLAGQIASSSSPPGSGSGGGGGGSSGGGGGGGGGGGR